MRRQNQSIVFTSWLAEISTLPSSSVAPLIALILGGWLALAAGAVEPIASQNPDLAEPIPGDVTIAQKVAERLPPPPQLSQEELPSDSFIPREYDFRAPVPNLPSPNFESYLVYVNGVSLTLLEQVQQLEPTAFVKQYNGRSVIQVGIFSEKDNAQEIARELESMGIGVQIVNMTAGSEN